MKVLITGGTGFIGSRLARRCLDEGDHVRILGQANTPAEQENLVQLRNDELDIVLGCITDASAVREALADVDVVYHLAAAQHEAGKSDDHFRRINVEGTRTMLEAAATAGVRRFVHGSTIGVYRADKGVVVRDDTSTDPDNIYGVTKLEAEALVREQDRVQAVIIRISETYGPGDRRLLKLFRGIQKGRFFNIGRSDNLHHPVYVDDLADGLRCAAVAQNADGHTIVIPGYETVTSRDMANTIADVLQVDRPKVTIPLWPLWISAIVMEKTLRPLGIQPPLHRRRMHFFIKAFEFSGAQAAAVLGYKAAVGFEEGIRRTAQWYKQKGLL
jgi:nucleoside-diphosphate-sugar epimerase